MRYTFRLSEPHETWVEAKSQRLGVSKAMLLKTILAEQLETRIKRDESEAREMKKAEPKKIPAY